MNVERQLKGKTYRLDCGHTVRFLTFARRGDSIFCVTCDAGARIVARLEKEAA